MPRRHPEPLQAAWQAEACSWQERGHELSRATRLPRCWVLGALPTTDQLAHLQALRIGPIRLARRGGVVPPLPQRGRRRAPRDDRPGRAAHVQRARGDAASDQLVEPWVCPRQRQALAMAILTAPLLGRGLGSLGEGIY